jgi:hypothetical protein
MAEYLGVYVAYHKATDLQARFFDLEVSTRVLQQITARPVAATKGDLEKSLSTWYNEG